MKKKFLLWATCLLPWLALSQINLGTTVLTNTVVASNLAVPWDMVYGPDGWIWFTELSGKIKRMHPDTYEVQTVFTLPDVALFGFSVGLHSMILHPDFNNNHYLYVHYAYTNTTSKIVRYEYDSVNNTLANATLIMGSIPAGVSHNGSRMVIVDDKLYICLGDTYSTPAVAQNLSSINGKVLRMNLDGSIPDDNPTAGSYVYSFGHRNPQGLCYANGKFYSSEHGTTANDEINIIEPNRNYGWPTVEGVCNTTAEIAFCNANNVAEPIWSWSPSIAPAGIDYYHNSAIPEWDHSLLLVVLKNKELIQLKLNEDDTQVTQQNIYLVNTYGRLRDLLVLPDGRVFICTSNKDYAGTPGATDDRIIELKNPAAMSTHVPDADLTKIYPIPAQGVLNIDSSVKINSVMVTDNVGKVIYAEAFTPQINTSSWATGMYFIQLLDADQKVIDRKKVLIE
ncbi:PQQ-dependent sugar dehydrogenase [Flavobacterium sp. CYK-55]|uniref:PQQ-dependent sugar dehydrogenase n=1 Tax=Flavobacterium sp. CYK-55 TaxID=2835529 RepID=UPI001BCA6B8E|nr:PQQ-dependent sugar dehydrogenase [Flavobacterium sp. CYK-55]MBS7787580.1 PQQ-dependent sugar dehydrogenase [Flavobacterium sp. CYK-55]